MVAPVTNYPPPRTAFAPHSEAAPGAWGSKGALGVVQEEKEGEAEALNGHGRAEQMGDLRRRKWADMQQGWMKMSTGRNLIRASSLD